MRMKIFLAAWLLFGLSSEAYIHFRIPESPQKLLFLPTYDDALYEMGQNFPLGCEMIEDAVPGAQVKNGAILLPVGTFVFTSSICSTRHGISLYKR